MFKYQIFQKFAKKIFTSENFVNSNVDLLNAWIIIEHKKEVL